MKVFSPFLNGNTTTSGSLTLPRHPISSSITNPNTGSIYHDTTDNVVKVYTGTQWQVVGEQTTPVGNSRDIEYLLVAGGAGGGEGYYGGGGGAGGYLSSSLASVSSGSSFTVTVGSGGSGGNSQTVDGGNGVDSSIVGASISTITATGGGGGASRESDPGASGGSGGGGAKPSGAGGSGTVGQGNDGGSLPLEKYGAGGGGASQAGQVPPGVYSGSPQNDSLGAPGGSGSYSNITGTSTPYAGGGGGGARATFSSNGIDGGPGGGGAGGALTTGTAGTANTGGGGGGGGDNGSDGGAGGSGVAIFAYDSGSINAAGGIVGDAGNGRKYHQFNASDTLKVGSTSDFQIVTSNLVSHFDAGDFASRGTSTWTDLSGNGHNISGNSITLGANFYNDFDGSTSYYSKSDTAHNFSNNIFTIEIWVKWDSLSNGDNIASKRGTGNPGTRNWLFGYDANGLVYFLQYNSSGNYTYPQTANGTVTTGTWYHLAATSDASNMKVYVNGTQEATATQVGSGVQSTSAPLEIGRRGTNSGYQYHDGQIAQFRAYSSALSASEVLQNYNATKTNFV